MNIPTVLPSESASGPYTACVWYSGLYVARALNPSIPGTREEMLALATLGGMPNGESGNFTLLAQALKSRYGLTAQVTDHLGAAAAYNAVMAAAAAGPVAVALAGDGYNLSPRYQSNHFGHAIAVLYDGGTTGHQFDPLAPAGYGGDPFPPAELAAFATAALIVKEEINMQPIVLRPVRQDWTTGVGDPGGVFFTGGPGQGERKHFNIPLRVTSIAEDMTAAGLSGNWRLVVYGSELLWFPRASLTPVADSRVPATGFGLAFGGDPAALAKAQADLAAALARLTTIKQKVAAGATDIADD